MDPFSPLREGSINQKVPPPPTSRHACIHFACRAGDVYVAPGFTSANLAVDSDSSGLIYLNGVSVSNVTATTSSSGDLVLVGSFESVMVDASSSGSVYIEGL